MAGKSLEQRKLLQAETKDLYIQGLGCREVASRLGEAPATIYRRLKRMGILRDRDTAYTVQHTVQDVPIPFAQEPVSRFLRSSAIGIAVRWFLDRGYVPSVPLEPTRYDLVVESDTCLKRVQVKSTNFQDLSGTWVAHVHRTSYDATTHPTGTSGKRRVVSYAMDEVDYFFIVVGDLSTYLIPVEVVGTVKNISLGKKYLKFKV